MNHLRKHKADILIAFVLASIVAICVAAKREHNAAMNATALETEDGDLIEPE